MTLEGAMVRQLAKLPGLKITGYGEGIPLLKSIEAGGVVFSCDHYCVEEALIEAVSFLIRAIAIKEERERCQKALSGSGSL